METTFAKTLKQLRKEAGFSTAYQFYHKNGGPDILKMTYRNYLLIEQGKTIPPLGKLGPLIWALRMEHGSTGANGLVRAWLQSMTGEENFREYIAPLLAAKPAACALSPLESAMQKTIAAQTRYYTLAQVKAMHSSPDHYRCFLSITTRDIPWKISDLAKHVNLPESLVNSVIKSLVKAKLVKKTGAGVYRGMFGRAYQRYPNHNTLPEELKNKIRESYSQLAKNGQVVYPRKALVLADEKDFHNFFPLLDAQMGALYAYAATGKSDNTALYLVENTVTKLEKF